MNDVQVLIQALRQAKEEFDKAGAIILKVQRTGTATSVAGSEYLVTFPDGETQTINSPPCHDDMSEDQEDAQALLYSAQLWGQKIFLAGMRTNKLLDDQERAYQ